MTTATGHSSSTWLAIPRQEPSSLELADSESFAGRIAGEARGNVDSQIWFMTLYDKDEVADLSLAEKRLLKAAMEQETRQRAQRRGTRRE